MNLRSRVDKLEQRTKTALYSAGTIILEATDPASQSKDGIKERWLVENPGMPVPAMLVAYIIVDPPQRRL